MFSSLGGSMFIMPVCYYPTTMLSVDDDEYFLEFLSLKFEKKLPILCFNSPSEAIEYTKSKHHYLPFTARCITEENDGIKFNLMTLRNEFLNPDRFKAIFIVATDYDMPGISGLELIKTMEFQPEISQYSHIIVTGKVSDEFKEKVAKMGKSDEYIRKDDPDYVNKLIQLAKSRSERIFQWYSYIPARILSRNIKEKASFFFDGNFNPIFNSHLKEKNICEFYVFDKQGSYIFLDADANLSWLFIRNENGIENSINLAKQYGAPPKIIDALKSKKFILSLYEKEDFDIRIRKNINRSIDWDKYILPATVFESDEHYLGFFPNLLPDTIMGKKNTPKYYYAFADDFPDNGIDKDQILSYKTFLQEQE